MSTKLHDFAAQVQYAASIIPAGYTSTEDGSAVDLIGADGRGVAVLHVGGVGGGTTVAVRLEQSADAAAWSAIPGATFPNVTAGSVTHAIGFDRAQRYVRAVADLTGGSPSANLCVAIGQQKKTI
jgi:hypothetical protein